MWSAALHLDDPRVSEAHAMVSIRGSELKLLALRGRFQIDGLPYATRLCCQVIETTGKCCFRELSLQLLGSCEFSPQNFAVNPALGMG